MATMLTIKEVAKITQMSEYAIRKGVTSGIYPAIRICGNPKGKILIDIDEFVSALKKIANTNITTDESFINPIPLGKLRKIAE